MLIETITFGLVSRILSVVWRLIYCTEIPVSLRSTLYPAWAWWYGARLEEAEKDPTEYRNLLELFDRKLKPGLRRLQTDAELVSPIDGWTIVHAYISRAEDGEQSKRQDTIEKSKNREVAGALTLEGGEDKGLFSHTSNVSGLPRMVLRVKNADYRLEDLLGVPPPAPRDGYRLHALSLFLPASEYHHFHSPADFTITHRIKIPGHISRILPHRPAMNPSMMWTNERVSLLGHWHHGFFAFVAVAATSMVGRIRLTTEPHLHTDQRAVSSMAKAFPYVAGLTAPHVERKDADNAYRIEGRHAIEPAQDDGCDPSVCNGLHATKYDPPKYYRRGEELGWFEVGSGIVLVFEAPAEWRLRDVALTPEKGFHLYDPLSVH